MKNIIHLKKTLFALLFISISTSYSGISQQAKITDIEHDLDSIVEAPKTSFFEYIYQMDGRPKIKIETNIKKLIRNKIKEEYHDALFQLSDQNENQLFDLTGRIRARGNVRKKVSYFPPAKFDFKKASLDSLGFLKLDKLKFVFPKNTNRESQKLLFKEFFLYELYGLIDSNAIRTKLVDIEIFYKGKKKYCFTGFLIEEEAEYARRKKANIVRKGRLIASALDRESFLKMIFFQYMIANTDYSVSHKHNLEMVKLPNRQRVVAMPYDFDYSGFVGQNYAIPYVDFPIESIHERYLFPGYRVSQTEYEQMVNYFLSIEDEVFELCEKADYMDRSIIKKNKVYLKSFYNPLRKGAKRIQRDLVKN